MALIKYFNIIQGSFLGSTWLKNDDLMCRGTSFDPALSWDRTEIELWIDLVTQDWPASGQRSNSGQLLYEAQPKALETELPLAKEHLRQYCGVGKGFCSHCRFCHECSSLVGGKEKFQLLFHQGDQEKQ